MSETVTPKWVMQPGLRWSSDDPNVLQQFWEDEASGDTKWWDMAEPPMGRFD